MAFTSKSKATKASNKPDHQLVIKVQTSKGYVTLGKVGLYDESSLHSKVTQLTNEELVKLISKSELSIVKYGDNEEEIELVI